MEAKAKQYRELAKQNKFKERREKYSTIRVKALIEVVRDFWRNKTVDGNSTARILRASLLQKH